VIHGYLHAVFTYTQTDFQLLVIFYLKDILVAVRMSL